MKKLLFISCVALLAACNNAATTDTKKDSTGTTTAAETPANKKPVPEMPYKLERPYQNWQPGDPQHALTVMTSLKAYETGDIATCINGFGDSVKIAFDNMRGTFSKDSLSKMFTADRANITSMTVKMDDWESVISEDKKEEWVTLWYKQIWTDKKGKTDSLACVDDAMIKNGKIVVLNEAVRHFPVKK